MTRTDLIKNLEYTKSKYKDKFVGTGEINIYEMVSDVLRYLNQPTTEINIDYYEELERLARIGLATEKAFVYFSMGQPSESGTIEFDILDVESLLDWAEDNSEVQHDS